jgi:alcohol dehydrogenase class IV
LGGGSAMDAGKIMWMLYEHPDIDFLDMAMRFMDIRKRIYTFPKMGIKANFIAIPTSAGTGSEVTPFAVITDENTGIKYPIAAQRYAEIASFVGLDGKTDEEKIEKLTGKISELKENIGIKKSIKDYGVDEKDFLGRLDEMAEQAFDDQCTGANSRYPLIEEIKKIYLNAFYGK